MCWELTRLCCDCLRVHLLHCGASVWGVAPLHRAQPAQPDHDGPPAQEQGPLEPPTMRTHSFRHANTPPRWGARAWRGRRRRGGRHPLIFLLFLEVFHLPLWTEERSVYPPPCLSSSIFSPTAGGSQALKVGALDGGLACIDEKWLPLLERRAVALQWEKKDDGERFIVVSQMDDLSKYMPIWQSHALLFNPVISASKNMRTQE